MFCALYQEKKINIKNLSYWNVDLQEAYYSSKEANQRYNQQKKR